MSKLIKKYKKVPTLLEALIVFALLCLFFAVLPYLISSKSTESVIVGIIIIFVLVYTGVSWLKKLL